MLAISYIYRKNKGDGFEMKKRIISYRLKVDSILSNPDAIPPERWNEILQEHLVQIGFFQHERLIHLIVTVTFAILTIMSFVFCGFPGGWDAGAFGADLTVCGAFDSIHYALLYARK